jgi:hypothetical protein
LIYSIDSIRIFKSRPINLFNSSFNTIGFTSFFIPEYCQRYAKPEDIGADNEELSDDEMSEDCSESGDEPVVGNPDP